MIFKLHKMGKTLKDLSSESQSGILCPQGTTHKIAQFLPNSFLFVPFVGPATCFIILP